MPRSNVLRAVHPKEDGPACLRLADGAEARLEAGGLVLCDAAGRELFRYCAGCAELRAPAGDLTLTAPRGKVRIDAATDVELSAPRDVVHTAREGVAVRVGDGEPQLRIAPDSVQLATPKLSVQARTTEVVARQATVAVRAITTVADSLAQHVGRYELRARRITEHARHAFREVTDLLQLRAGRVRTVVDGLYEQRARRTVMTSTEDTVVDGKVVRVG